MNRYLLLALVSLILWAVLAFGMALPTGWVHLFLAAATVLMAVAIVRGDGDAKRAK